MKVGVISEEASHSQRNFSFALTRNKNKTSFQNFSQNVPCLTVWMTIITYVLCLNLGMGAKDDIGRFPSFGGLKDVEHNMGVWDFQRITAALLLPLQ